MEKELLKSFIPKKDLNSKVWYLDKKGSKTDSAENYKIRPEVREKLLEISNQFISFLGVDVVISDLIIIGSLVNYNWSEYSDIDLHVVVDYDQFAENQKELYVEFFDLKKVIFNQKHNIKFFGYDVECFVQSEKETTFSSGVYSILFDEWISVPKKKSSDQIDFELLKEKSRQWMSIIDGVLDNIEDEDPEEIKDLIKKYKEKLKKFRNCGLEKGGEMSLENLVFKVLRRNGYIEKLYDYPTKMIDKKLSMKQ